MAAPTFVTASRSDPSSVTSTSATFGLPASTASGDKIIFIVIKQGGTNTAISGPGSGEVKLDEASIGGSGGTVAVFEYDADGTDPSSFVFTWSGASDYSVGQVFRVTGTNLTVGQVRFRTNHASADENNSTIGLPALTTAQADTLVCGASSSYIGGPSLSGGGYTSAGTFDGGFGQFLYQTKTTAGAISAVNGGFSDTTHSGTVVTIFEDSGGGAQSITPTGPTVSVTPGTLTVTPGAVAISPTGPTVSVTPGSLTVDATYAISPTGPTITVTPGGLTVTPGAVAISPTGPTISVTPGALTVTAGVTAISPIGPTVSVTPGTLTVAPGVAAISPTGPTVSVTPGTLTVVVATGTQDITPTGPTVSVTPGTLTVAPGAVAISPTGPTIAVTPGGLTVEATYAISLVGPTVSVTPGTPALLYDQAITPTGPVVSVSPGVLIVSTEATRIDKTVGVIVVGQRGRRPVALRHQDAVIDDYEAGT